MASGQITMSTHPLLDNIDAMHTELAVLRAENNMLKGLIVARPELREVVGHLRAVQMELQASAWADAKRRVADLLRRFDRESQ